MNFAKKKTTMNNVHKYRICPSCDFFCNVKEKYKFCPRCEDALMEKCSNCGEAIENPFAKYCGVCGSPYRNEKSKKLREI